MASPLDELPNQPIRVRRDRLVRAGLEDSMREATRRTESANGIV